MGIPGLTTFINNRSDRYLEYYELRDTYLVIDGNSVCCQIYNLYAKCNCAFGGDYDKFAQCVSDFFDELLKCNVIPLVLMDGGCEDKKLKTVISRTKEKIRVASFFSPVSQQCMKFFPLLNNLVFKEVLREKNIRHVQCLFEADNAIAAVARILNCPVLSYDSDFYIYGTLYIPFDTLEPHIVKSSDGQSYMKRCKIYRVEYLLNSFKGLSQSMLPLAAILLGNDYVKHGIFKNFFRQLKLRGIGKKRYNHRYYNIEATFIWLSRCTLDKAIIGILSRLRKPTRQKILSLIEININGYTNASADILVPLGFSKEFAAQVTTHSVNRIFKFDGDINNLTYIEETCNEGDGETSEDEEQSDELEILDTSNVSEFISSNALIRKLPVWFLNEFLMARYPSYFMDLLIRRLYVCPVQIEDHHYPSSIVISLKIISLIFALLKSGLENQRNVMRYMIRNCNNKITYHELESSNSILSCAVPSLYNLRNIPLIIRQQIVNNTLGIKDNQCINELLPEWILYIACMKYWTEYQELYRLHKCYAYSLFVSLLFNIIDSKIGKHRNMNYFQKKYDSVIQNTQKKRKASNYKPQYEMNVTIFEAYNDINPDDCLLAAPFFISHFEMDKKLYSNPKKFNRTIVHAFADFQSCLYQTMNLNALLDYPYPQIKIANLLNGTLLYNFCNNFKTRCNIDIYINTVLQSSPSLLRLLHVLLLKVRPLFPQLFQNEVNSQRKQVIRRKRVKSNKNEIDSDMEYFSADENLQESSFYDANNSFSMLNFT
ncbi:single-strand DNA endonuclease protein asteroid [Nomia melanderi]|uniref:single-strand DNA endonuclease protein asteroid n=1 Tax=Nomia melanderi TaxID=2448451 RepID=UPI0013045DCD|nr:protein asteroid [Nomia melanderi]